MPLKRAVAEIDVRAGSAHPPLLAVSIHRGVIPRSELTEDLPRAEDLTNYKLCDAGDLVLNRMRAFQGAIGVSPAAGLVSPDYLVLRSRDTSSARYLHHAFRSSWFVGEMTSRIRGIGSVELGSVRTPRINAEDLLAIEIPLPGSDEQGRIADFLDDQVARIDNIIAARHEQLSLLSKESQASLDAVFLATNDGVTRLGRFVRRIEQGWSPQCDSMPAGDDEWGVTKVSAIRPGRFIERENKRLPDDLQPRREYEIKPGDLLVTRANTPTLVGAFTVAPVDIRPMLILSDKIMRIALDPTLDPTYVAMFGQTTQVRDSLSGAGTGTSQSMVNIRGADIRDLRIPLADTSRQLQVVNRRRLEVGRLHQREQLISRQMKLLAELKRSLITSAVTGQFDVSSADGSQVPIA